MSTLVCSSTARPQTIGPGEGNVEKSEDEEEGIRVWYQHQDVRTKADFSALHIISHIQQTAA